MLPAQKQESKQVVKKRMKLLHGQHRDIHTRSRTRQNVMLGLYLFLRAISVLQEENYCARKGFCGASERVKKDIAKRQKLCTLTGDET